MRFSMKNPVGFVKHIAIASVLAILANFAISAGLGVLSSFGTIAGALKFLAIAALLWWATTFHKGKEEFIDSLISVFFILAFVGFLSVFTPLLSYGFAWTLEGVGAGLAGLYLALGLAQRIKI